VRSQITLIESENIDYYNNKFKTNYSYLDFRRNVITKGIELNNLVGKKLLIGNIKVEGHDLCRPCKHLEETLNGKDIIKEFLRRGGLRCEILTSGIINLQDKITIL
jgi:MOSC domain-containing protein YiiM